MKQKCPICNCEVFFRNCGYSSFDPTWYECSGCKLKVGICFSTGHIEATDWNQAVSKIKFYLKLRQILTMKQMKLLGIDETYLKIIELKKKSKIVK